MVWVDWKQNELSRSAIAALLDVSEATVYALTSGRRAPSRKLARHIEAATRDWKDGPIKATEWPRTKRGGRRT